MVTYSPPKLVEGLAQHTLDLKYFKLNQLIPHARLGVHA
ncbi:MAG: hypothetical protein JWP45_697 [Mucilaginibacter sp.]|nr:hypothetical protein [Mucilaginibacter sp.]